VGAHVSAEMIGDARRILSSNGAGRLATVDWTD